MKAGIDIGGMSIKIGLVNEENKIIARSTMKTRQDIPYQELFQNMADAVQELLKQQNLALSDCDGIGIGIPGTIDDESGVVLYSNNIRWENIPIVEELKKYLDTTIHIANDADVAALGEVCAGAAKGAKSAVLFTLGTGVGGGVIQDKKIFHGPLTGGCELGHMVVKFDGEMCTCGRRGCLEAYASATALLGIAKKYATEYPESVMNEMCKGDLSNMNGKIPFDAATAQDEAGKKVVEEYERNLACGIANVINIFRPEKIILGGGVAAQRENLTVPLQQMVEELCFGREHGQVARIVVSELGNDAGIIGAANLV